MCIKLLLLLLLLCRNSHEILNHQSSKIYRHPININNHYESIITITITPQPAYKMQSSLILYVVVTDCPFIFQLFTSKYDPLLVRWYSFRPENQKLFEKIIRISIQSIQTTQLFLRNAQN